jgi:hypothetical protein
MLHATPTLVFNHLGGDAIPTKHKEALHQLYRFAKILIERLMAQYKLRKSTIIKILEYDAPECTRISRTGRPSLNDTQVDQIIEYASESWEHRVLNFALLHDQLKLEYTVKTLEKGLK